MTLSSLSCDSQPCTRPLPAAPPEPVQPVLLSVRRTARRYPVHQFAEASPAVCSDIAPQSPGVPLTLALRLHDASGQAIQRAAVYVWHYDPSGWTLDTDGDELSTVALMRGVQVSDERGELRFHTVYPGRYRDNSVPVFLRIYFNDGRHVVARADGCLMLPAQSPAVSEPLQIAPSAIPTLRKPACLASDQAGLLWPDRLVADPQGGGLSAELAVGIAMDVGFRTTDGIRAATKVQRRRPT